MNMFLGNNRSFYGDGEGFYGYGFCFSGEDVFLRSDFDYLKRGQFCLMAPENESSLKDEIDEDWLRLSIAGSSPAPASDQQFRKNDGSSLVELELMPSSSNRNYQVKPSAISPEIRPPPPTVMLNLNPSLFSLGFKPLVPINLTPNSSSSPAPVSNFRRPYTAATTAVDFRVVQPPRRPHSGIWFTLLASQNQEKEALLPQISKSYLRIKDGRTRISVVLKYLVKKLKLGSESEIEIRCKGQRVDPSLTLQHVRDNVWSTSPRDFITLLPNSSTTNHIMVLHYARITSTN